MCGEESRNFSLEMEFLESYKHPSGYAGGHGALELREKIWAE